MLQVHYTITPFTQEDISTEFREKINHVSRWSSGMADVLDSGPIFQLTSLDNKSGTQIIKTTNDLKYILVGMGGDSAQYRTSVYIDNQLVKVNGQYSYLDMQLTKGKLSNQGISINVKKYKGMHIIYTISIPIGKDFLKQKVMVIKTDSQLFEVN